MINLKQKRKGIGGMFFISVSLICAFIMTFVINISRQSTIISMADNISHVIATNLAIHSFNTSSSSYNLNGNPSVKTADGGMYNPISHFTEISKSYGFMKEAPKTCRISWNDKNKSLTLEMGEFVTDWGKTIKPHTQTTKIENS